MKTVNDPAKLRWLKDIAALAALLIASVFVVYIRPSLGHIFFLSLLAIFFISKKSYFWFAFFFILQQSPGYLFASGETSHLPFFKIAPGVTITILDLFTALAIIKCLMARRRVNLKLMIPLALIWSYIALSSALSVITSQASVLDIIKCLRAFVSYSWIVTFTGLVSEDDGVLDFIYLVSPLVFFILFTQIYYLTSGREFACLFDPNIRPDGLVTEGGQLRPIMGGVLIVLLSYIGAFALMDLEKRKAAKQYLLFVAVISFLIIFISATRIFFAIFLIATALFAIKRIENLQRIFIFVFIAAIIIMALMEFGVVSREFLLHGAWERLAQGFDVVAGRGRTVETFQVRLENLQSMKQVINKNLLFGYGFSTGTWKYYDADWGFWNTILFVGLFGFFLFLLLFYSYFQMMLTALRGGFGKTAYGQAVKTLLINFCAILVGYFLTWDFFSMIDPGKIIFIMIFFSISEWFVKKNEPYCQGI